MSKALEKEAIDLESLTHSIKYLSNELEYLKERSSETTMRNKPPKFNLMRRNANSGSNNNHPVMSAQSSNIVLNIESMEMDQYCSFHQEYHSKKHAHYRTTT